MPKYSIRWRIREGEKMYNTPEKTNTRNIITGEFFFLCVEAKKKRPRPKYSAASLVFFKTKNNGV